MGRAAAVSRGRRPRGRVPYGDDPLGASARRPQAGTGRPPRRSSRLLDVAHVPAAVDLRDRKDVLGPPDIGLACEGRIHALEHD
jgi:hypothetical protein